MKKFFSMLFVSILVLALVAGCGNTANSKNTSEPETGLNYEDGVYYAETSNFDDHGWKAMVTVVVKNHKINEVFFDEIDKEGALKTFEAGYAENMKAKSGTTPLEAYAALEDALIKSQNPDDIDVVSGATHSSDTFGKLVAEALDGSPIKPSSYIDGLYKASEKDFDDHGWKSFAAIVIKDGKIASAFFDQISKEDGRYKTTDEEYAKNMESKSGTTPSKAHDALIDNLIKRQDADVDTVTGATHTAQTFRQLIDEALSFAK